MHDISAFIYVFDAVLLKFACAATNTRTRM